MLTILSKRRDIELAGKSLIKAISQAHCWDSIARQKVYFSGGNLEADVRWSRSLDLWFASEPLHNRQWYCWGFGDPGLIPRGKFVPIVETNPPHEGINRSIAGAFATDETGVVHLVHRGGVGGGRKGVGKRAFLQSVELPLARAWDGDRETGVLDLGGVSERTFLRNVSRFVLQVAMFKERVTGRPIHPLGKPLTTALSRC